MLNDNQAQAYLDRIGFACDPQIDHKTLDDLVYHHQSSIPFETVTLHRSGNTPSVEVDTLYGKIIERRFGGYCFELNKLFSELLTALGFNVQPRLSRAVRGRETRMPINHRGIIVHMDGKTYSVDVGFGGPMPAGALLLEDESEQNIRGELYIPVRVDHAWWNIDRITRSAQDLYDDEVPERRQTELALCTAHVDELDFDSLNHFFSQPGTLFHDHEIVNLRTEDGYLGLKDGVLTRRAGGKKEVIQLPDRDAVDDVLESTFGMTEIRNL